MSKEKTIIVVGLVTGVIALAALIGFIGQGNVRETPLYLSGKSGADSSI